MKRTNVLSRGQYCAAKMFQPNEPVDVSYFTSRILRIGGVPRTHPLPREPPQKPSSYACAFATGPGPSSSRVDSHRILVCVPPPHLPLIRVRHHHPPPAAPASQLTRSGKLKGRALGFRAGFRTPGPLGRPAAPSSSSPKHSSKPSIRPCRFNLFFVPPKKRGPRGRYI
jgi:hypothetical protein